jgi:hypothetical protein
MIKGTYGPLDLDHQEFVTVHTQDTLGNVTFPSQTWPIADGRVNLMVFLSPGPNKLIISRGTTEDPLNHNLTLIYIPLMQTPPLHLAIMVAKDSPLLIDCPIIKRGAISTAHSSLDAAIAKFRMTAYMWQALTAEDVRTKGLGRRSFRLEEEWTADTTSQEFLNGQHEATLAKSGAMRSTAKIHLIKSDRTVKEIRDADIAQENDSARNKERLFDYFLEALKTHGTPFESSAHPIVAGLILDSHFSIGQSLILGHAALGDHDANGISLGMFGSHLAYSWPRFLEEVSSCLLDTRPPGDSVGSDGDQCNSLWEACSISQSAFLHEVGHAFDASHTTGIMEQGYSRHWPENFLARTAYSSTAREENFVLVDGKTENIARWDMQEALSFRCFPHFWLPGDIPLRLGERYGTPSVAVVGFEVKDDDQLELEISSLAGIAQIEFNGEIELSPSVAAPVYKFHYPLHILEDRFPRDLPLKARVLGMNGKCRTVSNIWYLFSRKDYIRIPGSKVLLRKRSVQTQELENEVMLAENKYWSWATLLTRKKEDGTVIYASSVDVRTGCILDGAYVYFQYSDCVSERVNCGPRITTWGSEKHFGGHASELVDIPHGQEIVKIEVSRQSNVLRGIRVLLSNGQAGGALTGNGHIPETSALGKNLSCPSLC